MIKFSFPLVAEPVEDICPAGQIPEDCPIIVDKNYSGADEPTTTYGNLAVVNIPLESLTTNCGAHVSVGLIVGCPPETLPVEWDDDYSDDNVARETWAEIGVKEGCPPFTWEILEGNSFSLAYEETDERINRVYAHSNACGIVKIKVTDNAFTETLGEVDSSNLPGEEIEWDHDLSGDTVITPGSAYIAVKKGKAPYYWEVTGKDFSISLWQTAGTSNTLIASATSCGSAFITVTDSCGVTCEGTVRSDNGEWVLIETAGSGIGAPRTGACGQMSGVTPTEFDHSNPYHSHMIGYRGAYKLNEGWSLQTFGCYTGTHFQCFDDAVCNTYLDNGCTPCMALDCTHMCPSCVLSGTFPCCHSTYWGQDSCWRGANRYLYEWRCIVP